MTAPFDAIAAQYDDLWTNTPAGRSQRDAVWREIDPLFQPGDHVLDLGCGTGEDALHLMQSGVSISAFDSSPEMVRIARARGVNAQLLALESHTAAAVARALVPTLHPCDGILSDFGAINCVRDIAALRLSLASLIRPAGHLALCIIGRFCLAEALRFSVRGHLANAARRWSGEADSQSLGLRIYYPTVRQLTRALDPDFKLIRTVGIGMFPRPLARLPFFRALTDHRLLIFERNP